MITNKLRFLKTDGLSVAERKKNLRAYMKERRGENENRDVKEILLCENLFSLLKDDLAGAGTKRSFFVYLSFSSEAATEKLIELLREQGHFVYAPKMEKEELTTVLVTDETDFTLSDYGIREPVGKVCDGAIDYAIVPLLAVDKQGNRLGYGKGYYDRFFRNRPSVKKIGYCFDFQVVNKIPYDSLDVPLDGIVTDKRSFWIEK